MISGDKERLEQVVINIISNSIKYTPDNGLIRVKASADDENVMISIRDNGIGIPEEDIPRLFERFYRVEKSRTSDTGGTGLGLAIAKEDSSGSRRKNRCQIEGRESAQNSRSRFRSETS